MTRDEYYSEDLDPQILKNRKSAADNLLKISGITFMELYVPGIVTLSECRGILPDQPDRNMVLVAWKIDDGAWKVHTTGNAFISPNDNLAKAGRYSFTEDSHSWAWGMEPFLERAPAIRLRDRIIRLTREFGLEIESYEAEVVLRDK